MTIADTLIAGCGQVTENNRINKYQACGSGTVLCSKCKSKIAQRLSDCKEELEHHTHLFQNKHSPSGDIIAMGLMISAVSPFAKLMNERIEYLKSEIQKLEGLT